MRILVITKRQYTNKDLIDDSYGRIREIPMSLAEKGHTVHGVCLSYLRKQQGVFNDRGENNALVEWYSINTGIFYVFGLLRFLLRIRKTIKTVKPDIIWSCSDTLYGVIGHFFSRIYKCRSVIDLYDNFESFASYRIPILRGLFRKAVRESDGLSCVSHRLEAHIKSDYKREKSITVITNAIKTETFFPMDKNECRKKLGLPQDVLIIGTAGDLSTHRGADIIFRAITDQTDQRQDIHLAIAGPRSADTTIPVSDFIHDLHILSTEQVPVLFNSLDVAIVYNRSSLFGDYCFPQKLFEILACQRPIVAANVGVLGDILNDKPELLYTADDVESFMTAIKQQLSRQELLDMAIPTWSNQAELLQAYLLSVMENA